MKEQICFERLHQIENEVKEDAKIAIQNEFETQIKEQISVNIDDVAANVRDEQILALVAIVVQITNVLSFEVQRINLKDEQINELKNTKRDVELAKAHELNSFKAKIQDEVNNVKTQYEQQMLRSREHQKSLEMIIKEKEEELEKVKEEVDQRDERLKYQNEEIRALEEAQIKIGEKTKNFIDTISALEQQIMDLNRQLDPIKFKCQKLLVWKQIAQKQGKFRE